MTVPAQPAPACADECATVLRNGLALACSKTGQPVPDAHITHVPPLIPTGYEDPGLICPHGVRWYMAPTSEQIAEWVRDDVE